MWDPPNANVNGVVYSDGRISVGAPCVAPFVEVSNLSCEPVRVSWINSALFGDASAAPDILLTATDQSQLLPGAFQIIVGMEPSRSVLRSALVVASEELGYDVFCLHFSPEVGYFMERLAQHWIQDSDGQLVQTCDPCLPRHALRQSPAFAAHFAGNLKPRWDNFLLFPVSVVRAEAPFSQS